MVAPHAGCIGQRSVVFCHIATRMEIALDSLNLLLQPGVILLFLFVHLRRLLSRQAFFIVQGLIRVFTVPIVLFEQLAFENLRLVAEPHLLL